MMMNVMKRLYRTNSGSIIGFPTMQCLVSRFILPHDSRRSSQWYSTTTGTNDRRITTQQTHKQRRQSTTIGCTATSYSIISSSITSRRCRAAYLSSVSSRSTSSSNSRNRTGLFSIPELQTPSAFSILTQHAIQQCNIIRSSLASTITASNNSSSSISNCVSSVEEASDILCQLDDISKIVCNVIDAAELCRSVHTKQDWRVAAHESFVQLSDYLTILNADTILYEASILVSNTKVYAPTIWEALSEEQHRFVQLLQAEFVRDGIHLSHIHRMQVRELQNQMVQLESLFLQNITNARELFAIENTTNTTANDSSSYSSSSNSIVNAVTDVIPVYILEQHGAIVQTGSLSDDPTKTTTTPPPIASIQMGNTDTQILQTLLRYSPNPNLRQQIHYESMTSVSENLQILNDLQTVRHELASIQTFPSYVERNLMDKMIGTSTNDVMQFLTEAVQQNRTSFTSDMTMLSKMKQQIEGNATLNAWDLTYYSSMIKAQYYQDLNHTVSQYLTIPNCIHAMQILVQRLFGITMDEASLGSIEQWDIDTDDADPPQQPQTMTKLHKFQFTGPDSQPLGTMYLDLHSRNHKYTHAAHFTVRCGCALSKSYHDSSNSNNNSSKNNNNSRNNDNDATKHPQYQYPIIALVCNLSDTPTITHCEVETLFHEFGHALHSLLSRTTFQHLSGTRTALDFVETPSHLFENFVWDAQFLQVLGRHYSTGDVMPMNIIQQLQQSRYQLASIERQNQILYSLFDQKLFGIPDATTTNVQLFGALHQQLQIPYVEGTHWFTRFGHLVSYGGGYYGYLYSQVFARDIWTQCLDQQRSFNRTSGDQVWQKLLRFGGSKDPHAMLTDLLGRSPKVNFSS